MSSYAVTVLTPHPFADADRARVVTFIQAVSGEVAGKDFYVCGQPFDFTFLDLEEEEAKLVIQGWSPKGALQLATYCGSKINHIMLGMISSRLARTFDGWIELDGPLTNATSNPAVLTYDGSAGRVRTSIGSDVISPNVMDYWLGYDDFRLI